MTAETLSKNEEKILILIFSLQGSASEKEVKKVLGWSDEVLCEVRNSLYSKKLIHNLTPELEFSRNGSAEALKILMKRLFPPRRGRKTPV